VSAKGGWKWERIEIPIYQGAVHVHPLGTYNWVDRTVDLARFGVIDFLKKAKNVRAYVYAWCRTGSGVVTARVIVNNVIVLEVEGGGRVGENQVSINPELLMIQRVVQARMEVWANMCVFYSPAAEFLVKLIVEGYVWTGPIFGWKPRPPSTPFEQAMKWGLAALGIVLGTGAVAVAVSQMRRGR